MISGTKTQGAAAVPGSNKKTLMMISKFPTDKKTIPGIYFFKNSNDVFKAYKILKNPDLIFEQNYKRKKRKFNDWMIFELPEFSPEFQCISKEN